VGPPLLVGAGALGVLVALVAAVRARRVAAGHRPGAATAVVVSAAVLYGVAFLLLAPGLSLLVLLGYLMAAFGPVVLLGTLLAGALRSRLAAAVAAVLVLVLVAAWVSGVADGDVLGTWASAFAGGLARTAPRSLVLLLLAAGGVLWLALGWTAGREAAGGAPVAWTRPEAAARWGRVATVIAVLCPLPYALLRATWLTPWPLGVPEGTELQVVGEMRLQGLLLGGAAVAGAVLTAGLVARWGEVWPRWVPGLRGRPVPVAAAVVPGALVALVICSAAVPMAMMTVAGGEPWMQLVFPLPVWGPALGAATLAYALRRGGEPGRPGTIGGS
ncbi:hypothetical protein, partial [Pseudonocardia lacus]|uniref:hypothetical protein n=1 Tax=Pseudonocardia lacus TaxID=2835865 RepID=UPI001BDC2C63